MGHYIKTDFLELLLYNLKGQEMLAEEKAYNFPQDVLAAYVLGLYGENADMTAYVENAVDHNFFLAERMTRIRQYIHSHELETLAAFRTQVEADTLADEEWAQAEEVANALSDEAIEQQITEFFGNDPFGNDQDVEPASPLGWLSGGLKGLA